ncbi:MAG: SHOCT domain-containing protein [Halomonas sp.]|uniref:SHOCT domain-containing protein n=1 Tax=Halomonas sp. TaxID=1486246 RepID=UPI002870443F|nr:SHOCT domain-containing protein [Halomonas sp.]MDR9439772.1 SHOCT domain-containing protein [Halomonas sp.]
MMGWGNGHGWMGFGGIFMILFWGLVILGAVALLRWLWMSGKDSGKDSGNASRKTALDILQERYARGEIERDEYERKRRDLEG